MAKQPKVAKLLRALATPLLRIPPAREICIELSDFSSKTHSAVALFGDRGSRDPQSQSARLTEQFIEQNRRSFDALQVTLRRDYDGKDVLLVMESASFVGAVPLRSPLSARFDFGLVVQPRFPWAGIGPMLGATGWRVAPQPIRLPLLKRSERRVPRWVLSVMILTRIRALLDLLSRRFEMVRETRSAPKGTIHWGEYLGRELPSGRFLSVPCTFPDLRDDLLLQGAIRFTLEEQIGSLDTQRGQGGFVHSLLALADSLLRRVQAVPTRRPTPRELESWFRQPLRNENFTDGLHAIEWTVDERGLAGMSDLAGIPWTMPMESFFEAWVETVIRETVKQTGGVVKVGRLRQTISPITWSPSFTGSQRSLIPDLTVEFGNTTLIVDAKYKRHWEELQQGHWHEQRVEMQEAHRDDLMQVLAYANLAKTRRVICCLMYPCKPETWESLRERDRLFHRAHLAEAARSVEVWLTGVPMDARLDRVTPPLVKRILDAVRMN